MSVIQLQRQLPNGKWKYCRQFKSIFANTGFNDAVKLLEKQGIKWRAVRSGKIIQESKK